MQEGVCMKNNKGFSLLELIVVIAILAILSGIVITAMMNTGSFKVKKATELLKVSIGETKIEAMSKNMASLTILRDTSGTYYIQRGEGEKEKLVKGNVTISYTEEGSGIETPVESGHPLQFSFSRSSGAFTPIIDSINADGSYQYRTVNSGGTSEVVYCSSIIINCGSRSNRIMLVKDTGKYYVE